MNRKVLYWLLVAFSLGLVACEGRNSSQAMDWLVGSWYSKEWQVTYDIHQSDSQWTIKNKTNVLTESAKLVKSSNDKKIVLISSEGTKFLITKLDDQTIDFQQVAKAGLFGITKKVTFKKMS
ncbi:hypothetical protein [Enterococcus ratti]|uniref:Lipoprotein n=1 Tax=Enterococcus ratti TaxID=150033 RepID=A0A1L8W9J0_9ENTE|nr:hypothetical protein [Enterococcus ratti]OJG77679.1 hypothetical protein RV14_GL001515 [Enterococcus ratti]